MAEQKTTEKSLAEPNVTEGSKKIRAFGSPASRRFNG